MRVTKDRQRRPLLQRPIPLYTAAPLAGLAVKELFPQDWYEWRGGVVLLGFAIFLWGRTAPTDDSEEDR